MNYSDEVKFEQFSKIMSPEMIAMEHAIESKVGSSTYPKINKDKFSYRKITSNSICCPRTKKLKIINFTNKIDSEILQVNECIRGIKIKTRKINIEIINNLLRKY